MSAIVHHNPPPPQIATRRKETQRHALLSGARVRKGKYDPPPPTRYWSDVGKLISLDLTLQVYGIAPNAVSLVKIGGAA